MHHSHLRQLSHFSCKINTASDEIQLRFEAALRLTLELNMYRPICSSETLSAIQVQNKIRIVISSNPTSPLISFPKETKRQKLTLNSDTLNNTGSYCFKEWSFYFRHKQWTSST